MKLKRKSQSRIFYNHDKYITAPEFNKVTAEIFVGRSAKANLVTKTDFDTK